MINALFGFFWSAGSVAGPVVSGMLIGITGYDGLIVTPVASGVLFLLIQCLCKNEKTLLASEQEDDMDEATESARPHGLARRQPFMALTGGYPVLAGSLLLTIAGPQPRGNPMESNTLHRGRLIDHILLVVEDFEASKNFYTAVLSALEIPVITTANEYLLADELVLASRHSPEAAETDWAPPRHSGQRS